MSIYSDYKVGAISDEEFRNFGVREDRRDRYEREERDCYRCIHFKNKGCAVWECNYEVEEDE